MRDARGLLELEEGLLLPVGFGEGGPFPFQGRSLQKALSSTGEAPSNVCSSLGPFAWSPPFLSCAPSCVLWATIPGRSFLQEVFCLQGKEPSRRKKEERQPHAKEAEEDSTTRRRRKPRSTTQQKEGGSSTHPPQKDL